MNADDAVTDLQEYCEFGESRVYLLLAIARRKENPSITGGTGVTFRAVVGDRREVRPAYERLRCQARASRDGDDRELTFRLYVTANARSTADGYFNFRERMDGWVRDWIGGDEAVPQKLKRIDRYWQSELQKPAARDDRRFVFDLDDASELDGLRLVSTLEEHTAVVTRRQTPHGYHVVTEPFDYNELETDVDYELKTDGLLFVEYLDDR